MSTGRNKAAVFLILLFFIFFLSKNDKSEKVVADASVFEQNRTCYSILLKDAEGGYQYFRLYNGGLDQVVERTVVAPLFSDNVPVDMSGLAIDKRKELFCLLLLPNVIEANREILKKRIYLQQIRAKEERFARLNWKEEASLQLFAREYRGGPDAQYLLERVDIIPISLALAQGALESGWGISRFTREGNGLYGLHFSANGEGEYLISGSGKVKVASYQTVYDATVAYMHNLNTNKAYRELREIRARFRRQEKELQGKALAEGLSLYSEKGAEYGVILQKVIRVNGLDRLDKLTVAAGRGYGKLQFL